MRYAKFALSASLIAIGGMHTVAAHAQTDPGDSTVNEEGGLQEIVVTAQKRTESLSRTAAAVSVVGQQTLDSIGARSFNEAVTTIPSLSVNGLGGTFAIRGLGTTTLGGGNSTVAFHVDGIFQSELDSGPASMYDIARIEVLRGPQGTLYGRSATAGVVNLITNDANPDKFEAFGDISYGSWNTLRLRGVVNVPISDSFAVRLTAGYEKGEDWQRYPNGDHPNGADVLNLRLAWQAKPTDRITWDGRLVYTRDNSLTASSIASHYYNETTGAFIRTSHPIGVVQVPSNIGINGLPLFGVPGIPSVYKGLGFEEATDSPERHLNIRSRLRFELSDDLSLTYLLGYSRNKTLPGSNLIGPSTAQVRRVIDVVSNIWSHELNLNYESERLKAVFGLYSYQTHSDNADQLVYLFLPTYDPVANTLVSDTPFLELGDSPNSSNALARAVFGQATFDVTDRFRITGGARYNWDNADTSASTSSLCPFGSGTSGINQSVALVGGVLPLCSPAGAAAVGFPLAAAVNANTPEAGQATQSRKFTWKAAIEYDLAPDTMFYATVSTGYKAGRTAVGTTTTPPVRPETNMSYEAGIRSRLFNNTLSLNLTGFWMDYTDQQVQTTVPGTGQTVTINAGKSRSRGIEFEYAWAPTRADRIDGYLTYLDAKFIDFPGSDDLTGIKQNFAGKRLAGAPEFTARISYSHIFDLGSAGTITPTASVYYQTKAYVAFTNSLPTLIPAYSRSDINVRYETENKRFSLEGYVNNIENKAVLSSIFPFSPVVASYYTPPRSYGVRLGFRY